MRVLSQPGAFSGGGAFSKRGLLSRRLSTGGGSFVQNIPEFPIVAMRGHIPNAFANTAYTRSESRMRIAIGGQTAAGIRLGFANTIVDTNGTGEIAPGNAINVEAALENAAGTLFKTVTFGGASSVLIPSGGFVWSDYLTTAQIGFGTLGAGGQLFVRSGAWVNNAGEKIPVFFTNGQTGDGAFVNTNGAGQVQQVGAMTAAGGVGAAAYGPTAIGGKWLGTKHLSVFYGLDSIAFGANDTSQTSLGSGGNGGMFARALWQVNAKTVAWTKLARGGDRIGSLLTNGAVRNAIKAAATDFMCHAGTNDLSGAGALTGPQLASVIETVGKQWADAGVRFHYSLLFPKTSSSDQFRTPGNQSRSVPFNTARDYVNQFVLDKVGSYWLAGVIDLRPQVEDPNDHEVWKTDGVTPFLVTDDGTHVAASYMANVAAPINTYASALTILQ